MHLMWFNTGVTPQNCPTLFGEFQEWRGGTLQIKYYLEYEPPDNWTLQWLCDYVNEGEKAIPIVGGGMLSKYAIFTEG